MLPFHASVSQVHVSLKLFCLQGADVEGTVQQYPSELCLPKHSACHNDLAPYSELMKWLKEVDQEVFKELCQVSMISKG